MIQTLVTEPYLVCCGTTVLVGEEGFEALTHRPDDPLLTERP
ncbi:hypothetical protein [Blastococcus brunescens]|uniref:Uncharacterized protein n=1 Tax=Blastococcus brunescens TaxID=1564165 RepID=A0ABZ1AYE9_9ACTN|nr:hypothetical protein [Blastococcus sp. BMG 8361]WRL63596.1 hypothetical protein U6N30_28615 [Blastococcus sp. BMG 8361]